MAIFDKHSPALAFTRALSWREQTPCLLLYTTLPIHASCFLCNFNVPLCLFSTEPHRPKIFYFFVFFLSQNRLFKRYISVMVFTPLCRMERSLRHDPCLSCYRRRRFGIGSRGVFGRVHPAVLNPSFSSLLPIGLPERFAPAAFAFAKRPLPGKGQMKRAWKHASRPFSLFPYLSASAV